jgi:ESF2/ABP1 family protein
MPSDAEQKSAHKLLGLSDSDVDDVANSSDEEEEGSKAANISQHRTKRRRMEPTRAGDDGSDSDDGKVEESEGEAMDERFSGKRKTAAFAEETETNTKKQAAADKESDESITTNPSKLKSLTAAQLTASKEATAKTGVVYLSRIPPFMKPQKVRDLLARFGEVGRVFLAPEDPKAHAKRVRFGGNKKRNFTEGWVEFKDKKDATICAETLNTQIVGGKKRSYYYDDVWNIKYLPKFKWHHLQAQIGEFLCRTP